jgi:AbrB family looped-hinge helix DNA binding protein
MHKVSTKRQITIPKDLCEKADIQPGDLVEIFEHQGKVTVIKKQAGASAGVLKHLKPDATVSDEESLADALANKSKSGKKRSTA